MVTHLELDRRGLAAARSGGGCRALAIYASKLRAAIGGTCARVFKTTGQAIRVCDADNRETMFRFNENSVVGVRNSNSVWRVPNSLPRRISVAGARATSDLFGNRLVWCNGTRSDPRTGPCQTRSEPLTRKNLSTTFRVEIVLQRLVDRPHCDLKTAFLIAPRPSFELDVIRIQINNRAL